MEERHDEIRRALAGRYELHEVVGSGGMATVFRATDLKHGRRVAVKVLEPDLARAVGAERFLREIHIAAQLQHPGILPLFDSGDADGHLYYVMPLAEGATLADALREDGPLPLDRALEIAGDVAAALDHAHAHGVVHRDVKPGNILLQDGRAVLADFGLARALEHAGDERLTVSGTVVGTPTYMSPEQATGRGDPDGRSDLYSLGCVVYEMLAGQPPFEGRTAQAILARHASDSVPPVSTIRPQLPAGFDAVLERALAKVPADRFDSSGEFLAALREPETAATPTRRRRLPVVLAAATLAAAALVWALGPWPGAEGLGPRRMVRLTFDAGPEYSGNVSLDARQLVYGHTRYGTMDLFLRPRRGGEALRLTDEPGDEMLPRWSPSGADIAYVAPRGNSYAIFQVAWPKGEPRFVVDTHIPLLEDFWDAQSSFGSRPYSPDGGRLLFSRALGDGRVAVHGIDLDTRTERPLTTPPDGCKDFSASWSFAGDLVVFSREKAGIAELWSVSPSGEDEQLLLAEPDATFLEPCFLPGDRHVLCRSDRAGTENIWAFDRVTGELQRLTSGGGADQFPNVSRDGLVTFTQFSHQTDLYELDLSSGEATQLTRYTQDNFAGRYDSRGRRVAYHSTRTGDPEVMVLDLGTGAERNLSDHPARDLLPAWSPDDREIAFVSNRDGAMRLWAVDVESGRVERVSDQEIEIPSMVWGATLSVRWTPTGRPSATSSRAAAGRACGSSTATVARRASCARVCCASPGTSTGTASSTRPSRTTAWSCGPPTCATGPTSCCTPGPTRSSCCAGTARPSRS